MKDYITVDNYSGLGSMGISRNAIASIASQAVDSVAGASLSQNKRSNLFSMSRPVKVSISKDGRAEISVEVSLKEGVKVKDICLKIQQEIVSQITMMCETIPVEVKVKVAQVG